ncbi:MAG: helix-turn-helix domain-containing protein [Lachnospiraceae bacterium]|nr:helix-turn-helix domain-containing protein [Lachnospiraceae bacterium]
MENINQTQERFGAKLAECRRNKGFTQEELANRLGVTPQALSKWEKGLSSPDIAMVSSICMILDISADYLLEIGTGKITEDGDMQRQEEIWRFLQSSLAPLKLIFGTDVVAAFLDNRYADKISELRVQLAWEGILFPILRIRDEGCIKPKEFYILAYENVLYKEELTEITEETIDYMVKKLEETVRSKYGEILNVDIIKKLTDNLKIQYPALIDGIVPQKIPYGLLLDVCRKVLERGNGMVYLPKIIEVAERVLREQQGCSAEKIAEQVCFAIERKDNFWVMIKSS